MRRNIWALGLGCELSFNFSEIAGILMLSADLFGNFCRYCWFSSPGIVVQSAVKVLHRETIDSIVCPFRWVWANANTPPKGNSTIRANIQVVGEQQ
jgi:hypothetical protein